MYEKILLAALLLCIIRFSFGQDPWTIKAGKVDAANYYGITVANGMIGIVSSPEPFKVKGCCTCRCLRPIRPWAGEQFLTQLQPPEYDAGY